ncbi:MULTISPECIES: hypothetical protein [Pontibacter]|nr:MULTISPECIES: hypothetical protein [Pontibacter]
MRPISGTGNYFWDNTTHNLHYKTMKKVMTTIPALRYLLQL